MVKRGLKLVILPLAKADIKAIVKYIAKGSPKYARLEKELLITFLDKLYEAPFLGKPFEHKSSQARQLIYRNYLIIYRIIDELSTIEILTIHHHSRSFSRNPAIGDDD